MRSHHEESTDLLTTPSDLEMNNTSPDQPPPPYHRQLPPDESYARYIWYNTVIILGTVIAIILSITIQLWNISATIDRQASLHSHYTPIFSISLLATTAIYLGLLEKHYHEQRNLRSALTQTFCMVAFACIGLVALSLCIRAVVGLIHALAEEIASARVERMIRAEVLDYLRDGRDVVSAEASGACGGMPCDYARNGPRQATSPWNLLLLQR